MVCPIFGSHLGIYCQQQHSPRISLGDGRDRAFPVVHNDPLLLLCSWWNNDQDVHTPSTQRLCARLLRPVHDAARLV